MGRTVGKPLGRPHGRPKALEGNVIPSWRRHSWNEAAAGVVAVVAWEHATAVRTIAPNPPAVASMARGVFTPREPSALASGHPWTLLGIGPELSLSLLRGSCATLANHDCDPRRASALLACGRGGPDRDFRC